MVNVCLLYYENQFVFLNGKDGYLETWHHYSSVEMVNTDTDFISFVNIMYQFLESYVCKVPS